jgi:hypothetical protein
VDELVGVGHARELLQPREVDADSAAVGLVGLERRGVERQIDHPHVRRIDGPDLDAVLREVDLALVHQHAHGVKRRPERIRAHDGVEHLASGYAPIR